MLVKSFFAVSRRAVLFGLMLFAPLAKGVEYFVDSTGSNAADGSLGSPWKTLQHAADEVLPGDRVVAQSGPFAF